jgi:hypothetical protein
MVELYRDDAEELIYSFFDGRNIHESEAHEALPMLFERASGKNGVWVFLPSAVCDKSDPLGQRGYIGVALRGNEPAVRGFVAMQTQIVRAHPEIIGEQWVKKAEAWIQSETSPKTHAGEPASPVRDIMSITRGMLR